MSSRLLPGVLLAASLSLGGCTMLDGYGGFSVGSGTGYYDDYDPYYGGYQSSYYGWYDDTYYPGTGYYVYDRGGARHRWSDRQRYYWEQRRGRQEARENWSGYRRDRARDGRWDQRDWRPERRGRISPGVAEGARILGARPSEVQNAVRGTSRPRRDWAPGGQRRATPGSAPSAAPVSRVERAAPPPAASTPASQGAEQPARQPRERVRRVDRNNPNVREE